MGVEKPPMAANCGSMCSGLKSPFSLYRAACYLCMKNTIPCCIANTCVSSVFVLIDESGGLLGVAARG